VTGATLFVPGRIELLGKHTDYAGGSSLLVATERGFSFRAEPLPGPEVVLRADDTGEEARYRLRRADEAPRSVAADPIAPPGGAARPGWTAYGDAVLERLAAELGDGLRGARIAFSSDLPPAAGLSSSSALITGLFLGLDAICGFTEGDGFRAVAPDREALASWLAAVERGDAVGTRGGSEDHTAILLARPDHVVRYAFAPVRARGVAPLPPGWVLAVGASGVVAEKSGAARGDYNRLSDLASDSARVLDATVTADSRASRPAGGEAGSGIPHLGAARQAFAGDDPELLAAVRAGATALRMPPAPLVRRVRHFLEETALVDDAFDALVAGDLAAFAGAANRSASRGAALLENQVPETMALTRMARELGAAAASPFGAGFGGSVWALAREEDADPFLAAWEARYRARYPHRRGAVFFTTRAGGPARTLP
jgi:galactokinase